MDTTNQWKVVNDGGGTDYYFDVILYSLKKDTVINGLTYKCLYERHTKTIYLNYPIPQTNTWEGYSGHCFREDTLLGRVYAYYENDTAETVIYDSSWQIGDTILTKCLYPWRISRIFITRKDLTYINGQAYHVFRFEYGGNDPHHFSVIEGIGTTGGLSLFFAPCPQTEQDWRLFCFQHENYTPPLNPSVTGYYFRGHIFDNATSCTLGVNGEPAVPRQVSIAPFPITEQSVMTFPRQITQGSVTIYNSTGSAILEGTIQATDRFAIGQYLTIPGLYFFQVKDLKQESTFSGRLIVH